MSRETLVMLPGMMCDERLFAPQIAALEADCDIIVPQLCAPASIEGMAKRLLGEVKASHFNLLGLSMGGIVAMALAGLAPERVKRLALLDTNHLPDAPERRPIRDRQIADVMNGKLRAVIVEEMKPNYLAVCNRGNSDLLGTLVAMALDLGPQCFVAQSIALRDRADQSQAIARFPGPLLLMCGKEDELCPVSRHQQMQCIARRGVLRIIPGAGHIVTLEQMSISCEAIAEWLAITA